MVKKDEPSYCQQDSSIAKMIQLPPLYHQYIKFQSRRRSLQRLLSLSVMTFENLWFPIFKEWIGMAFSPTETLYLAMDSPTETLRERTQ